MSALKPLYLDHAATAPVLPAARDAFARGLELWANPSSPHRAGRAARAALEDARERVRAALDWPHEVVFTSGASEALAIALGRASREARIVSPLEHEAVLRPAGEQALRLAVDGEGIVDPASLDDALKRCGGRALVAIQHVNNETGVIQPLAAVAAQVHAAGGLLLADCAQSAGKLGLPPADLIALSGHKFGAPPGIGALLVRDFAMIEPAGGQERGYRPGTENLPGAMAMAAALEEGAEWLDRAATLRRSLEQRLAAMGAVIVAEDAPRIASIGACRLPGLSAAAQLIRLDAAGIAVSAGSACSSGSLRTSHVLTAMGMDPVAAGEVIRVSIGRETSEADLERFAGAWERLAVGRQRAEA